MKKQRPPSDIACPWYTVEDMSVLFSVVDRTIWKWVAMGRLPKPIRKSRKWVRWVKEEIDELVRKWGRGA